MRGRVPIIPDNNSVMTSRQLLALDTLTHFTPETVVVSSGKNAPTAVDVWVL